MSLWVSSLPVRVCHGLEAKNQFRAIDLSLKLSHLLSKSLSIDLSLISLSSLSDPLDDPLLSLSESLHGEGFFLSSTVSVVFSFVFSCIVDSLEIVLSPLIVDPALKGESFCAVLGSHTRCTLIALSRGSSQSHPPSKDEDEEDEIVIIREAPSQALTTQDHEKEIVPFAQEPGVGEYATVMEKIVRGLSLKTSFGEQRLWSLCPFVVVVSVCPFDDTYTIMWSLCPFVEDEIMNRA
ncbi:Uncharacterized protein Rs2_27191 [Raphanus sativus]|nr:Uncharacterized protein Rs2_27191 [Raphanus sativus]